MSNADNNLQMPNDDREDYRRIFRRQVFQLLKWGYDRLNAAIYQTAEEEDITGDLVKELDGITQGRSYPHWVGNLYIFEDPRVNVDGRKGKRRQKIDIEFVCVQHGPRPRFYFEAKRLSAGTHATIGKYLGSEGLGEFLAGTIKICSQRGTPKISWFIATLHENMTFANGSDTGRVVRGSGAEEIPRGQGDRRWGTGHIGAGTVLTEHEVQSVAVAGGTYIVSPNTNAAVIKETKRLGLISIPGFYTPSEAFAARDAGADYLKLFPARDLGVGYLNDIKAVVSEPIIAVGGVDVDNISEFLAVCAGVGIGSNLYSPKRSSEAIRKSAEQYVAKLMN